MPVSLCVDTVENCCREASAEANKIEHLEKWSADPNNLPAARGWLSHCRSPCCDFSNLAQQAWTIKKTAEGCLNGPHAHGLGQLKTLIRAACPSPQRQSNITPPVGVLSKTPTVRRVLGRLRHLQQRTPHPSHHVVPIALRRLPEKPRSGVPRTIRACEQPAEIGHVGQ